MRKNKTRAKLLEGKRVVGGIINLDSPALVELFGVLGYDFMILDGEHGPLDLLAVEHMVRAAEAFDITPLARVPNHEESTILRFLDRGVQGIMVPHINTGEEAQAVVRAAKYYPQGSRGFYGSGRAADYGVGHTLRERLEWANQESLIICMLEDIEGLKNLKDILSVEGVDVLLIGPGDLAQSMGFPSPEEVDRVMLGVVAEIRAAGKVPAVGGEFSPANASRAKAFMAAGCRFVNVSVTGLLREAAQDHLKWVQRL